MPARPGGAAVPVIPARPEGAAVPALLPWLRGDGGGCVIALHIQPGAKRTEVAGEHGEALKIRLAAPPVDGKANAALIEFVANRLGVPKSAVTLKSGQASRRKVLAVAGVAPADALRLLAAG